MPEPHLAMSEQPQSTGVNLVVALPCEARPLIRHFQLRQLSQPGGMRIYTGDQAITLIVSGVGKLATATACGLLAGLQQQRSNDRPAWLNVGIAGHGRRSVGESVLISKVVDRSSGQVGYPPLLIDAGCSTSTLITVDEPETDYVEDAAYDMEGSAFQRTTTRFVTAELVQLLKIVSDTPLDPVGRLSEATVSHWVQAQLPAVERLVAGLTDLATQYNALHRPPDSFEALAGLTRLSTSQRLQLEALCRRYQVLGGSNLLDRVCCTPVSSGRQLLQRVAELIPVL